MDIEALKQGLSAAKVDEVPVVKENGVVETIVDNIETEDDVQVDDRSDIIDTGTPAESEFDSDEKLVAHFSKELGFEGVVEGEGLDALLFVAKQRLEQSEKIANDERVKEFLAHVERGGDIESYQLSQPTNIYGELTLDEADTDFTENVVRECLIVLRNFDDEDDVREFITNLKDSGKLFEYAEKNLSKLQKKEQDENVTRKAAIDKQLEDTRNEAVKYYKELGSAFDTNLIPGVVVDKKNLSIIKQLSLPDKHNQIAIQEVLDEMPTAHIATMNTLAWCLANGQAFEFKPGVKTTAVPKPVHTILNKGASANGQGKRTLASVINSKMNSK